MDYGLVDILKLIGSISLFLFAMKIMSEGIQKATGKTLRSFLNFVTTNKYLGVVSGFLITGIIQSSSATSVMVVSFVNAGILTLKQSVGVIMGANIGTTVTSWLINSLGFSNFELLVFALPAIGLGVPIQYSGNQQTKAWGEFLIGFGLLFLGLDLMKSTIPIVEDFDIEFLSFLQHYTGTWYSLPLFIVLGTVIAIILQSSSTAMGITIVLLSQGWLPINAAIGLILGENIGTTVTANLASIVGSVNAKRAARIHFLFNIIGVLWVLAIIPWFVELVDYVNMHYFGCKYSVNSANLYHRGVAMTGAVTLFHSLFNIINTLLLIHFVPLLIAISKKLVPTEDGNRKRGKIAINNFVDMPEMAVMQANKQLLELAQISSKMLKKYRELRFGEIEMNVNLLKKLEKFKLKAHDLKTETTTFLIDVSQLSKSDSVTAEAIKFLSVCNELQRVIDELYILCMIEKTCYDEGVEYEPEWAEDLQELAVVIEKTHNTMLENLKNWDKTPVSQIDKFHEGEITSIKSKIGQNQIEAWNNKQENVKTLIYFRDTFKALEKTSEYIFVINQFLKN